MDLFSYLRQTSYPGRGIALGRTADGQQSVILYFIMGRSENSRNRIFERTEDGIRTKAFDEAKMTDPSLIIYHPVRQAGEITVVTNGDQTDTIAHALKNGSDLRTALATRIYEPDGPNWTPRISGILCPDGAYSLSILKRLDAENDGCCRYCFDYEKPAAGLGHFISTYEGDGSPLPSFRGEPKAFSLGSEDAETLAKQVWDALNPDNRVSLYVRVGGADCIINRHG